MLADLGKPERSTIKVDMTDRETYTLIQKLREPRPEKETK